MVTHKAVPEKKFFLNERKSCLWPCLLELPHAALIEADSPNTGQAHSSVLWLGRLRLQPTATAQHQQQHLSNWFTSSRTYT